MATQVQRRRGTTAQHSTFTGALGEITIDTDKDTVVVHDGATAGGFPLLRQDLNNLADGAVTFAKVQDIATARILGRATGGSGDIEELTAAQVSIILGGVSPPVRQTVLSGPVSTSGYSAFGGSTGSTTVTASGTLIATAANGASNRTGSSVNPSWTGLSTNGTMFLYLDIAADGTCTTGSTTLAPTYRWGGADVTTNNQHTFNIQEMQMKVGNGSTASQTWRVFVGEVTVSGSVVTAITWYALMGRYQSPNQSITLSSYTSISHNIGCSPLVLSTVFVCLTTDVGYAVGNEVRNAITGSTASHPVQPVSTGRTTCGQPIGPGVSMLNGSTGATSGITTTSWNWRIDADRGW
jgi:hypothetical protein